VPRLHTHLHAHTHSGALGQRTHTAATASATGDYLAHPLLHATHQHRPFGPHTSVAVVVVVTVNAVMKNAQTQKRNTKKTNRIQNCN